MTTRLATTGDRIHPGGEYHALPDPVSDRIFSVVMSLAAEVWTLRDRLRIAEATLAEHGIVVEHGFESGRQDEARLAAMALDRDAFVERLLGPLTPAQPN